MSEKNDSVSRENYLQALTEYFVSCKIKDFDEKTMDQVRRCLLDYFGCSVYAARHGCSGELVNLIAAMGAAPGEASVWGEGKKLAPAYAAFANACRTSNIELDDCSGIGASVHPGVYVMSAALAVWEADKTSAEDFVRAVVFGYDVCMRMGLLATEKVRELGLHGPGMIGGLSATATAGLLGGLSAGEIRNALAITAALLPLCPFSSFMEGAGVKDLYGGWGVYLGMFAVEAAKKGITGPKHIIEGEKSLLKIFGGAKGLDVAPGTHFYINDISFKRYSACHSVHPAMTAIEELQGTHRMDPEKIKHVVVTTYPYSYALNQGATDPLNPSSARLSLSYTVAMAILDGGLSPDAFLEENMKREDCQALRKKIQVEKNDGYGDGPFGVRGSRVRIEMTDGQVYEKEVLSPKWSSAPSNEELLQKFSCLTGSVMTPEEREILKEFALQLGADSDICKAASVLRGRLTKR